MTKPKNESTVDIAQQLAEAKETLNKYKERLDQAQKAGKLGIFEWDIKTNKIWWSDEEEPLFGVPPGKFKGDFKDWLNSIYAPDRKRIKEEIKTSIKTNTDLDTEFRVLYPGNIVHWIKAKGHIYIKNKTPHRMVGIHYDITSRKHEEELLIFKAEASRVLSSSLDYHSTLTTLTNLAISHIADWCAVDIYDEATNKVTLVSAAHKDPKKVKWARQIRDKYPVDMNLNEGLPYVLKTGKSVFIPFISTEEVLKTAKTEEQRSIIKKIGGVNSIMMVPITLGKKTIGAITFVAMESTRRYTEIDLELAKQLASRASLAIENSRLYEAVKNEQIRLDDLLDNVPAVVWESWDDPTTPKQKITYVSSYAEKLLGYPRRDWLTKPNFWKVIMHPEDQEQASKVAKDNYENKERGISRFRWLTKSGRPIWVESQSFIIKNDKGKPVGMRGVVLDITDTVEKTRRKDEFISLASHELKTPITTIKAYTQLLQSIETGTITQQYLLKVEKQVNKLTRLISELLDVTKVTSGKLDLHKTRFNLNTFLGSIISELQSIIKTHELISNVDSDIYVSADPDRIEQIITNLVTNAAKYSPEAKKININSFVKNDTAYIEVQDFGIGIPSKDLVNIFSRFYRASNGIKAPGLGIGLFIAREIANRHGGDLSLKSTLNEGSTFTFSLPIFKHT